jgi:predicted homoserine dehydrogenase-like protein
VQFGAGTLVVIAGDVVAIVIDAAGAPAAGIGYLLACCRAGKHIVMVNVEAEVLAGPLQAWRAREAGVVYSLAYGDQPALIGKPVDHARAAGFEVIAAGKGTRFLPACHQSTLATVWQHDGLNAQMSSPSHSAIWRPANGSTAKGATRSSVA